MAVSEAQKKASKKYFDNNYKQVKLSMPIKEAEALEAYCQKRATLELVLYGKQLKKKWKEMALKK